MRIYIPQLCQIFTYLCLTFKFESFNLWLALPWRRSTSWILSTSAWSRSPPSLTSTGPSSGTTALSTLPSKKLVDFHFTPFLHLIVLGGYLDEVFIVFFISFADPDPAKDERADLIKTWFIILVLWILYYCRTVLKNRKWQIPVVGRFFFLIWFKVCLLKIGSKLANSYSQVQINSLLIRNNVSFSSC